VIRTAWKARAVVAGLTSTLGSLRAGDTLHCAQGFFKPAAEISLARDDVEHSHPRVLGLHSEASIDERPARRASKNEVNERPCIHTADPHLAQLVEAIDDDVEFLGPKGSLRELAVVAPFLQPFAFDLNHARPPFRVTINIANKVPDNLDWCVNPGLLAAIGHVSP
jgi:hypothetical protein